MNFAMGGLIDGNGFVQGDRVTVVAAVWLTENVIDQVIHDSGRKGFGDCSNHGECEAVCPKGISIKTIAQMRRDYLVASLRS